ncbi:hypothetical protein BC831DRAFT_482889, partial [Entophlyctis helioformis]
LIGWLEAAHMRCCHCAMPDADSAAQLPVTNEHNTSPPTSRCLCTGRRLFTCERGRHAVRCHPVTCLLT